MNHQMPLIQPRFFSFCGDFFIVGYGEIRIEAQVIFNIFFVCLFKLMIIQGYKNSKFFLMSHMTTKCDVTVFYICRSMYELLREIVHSIPFHELGVFD